MPQPVLNIFLLLAHKMFGTNLEDHHLYLHIMYEPNTTNVGVLVKRYTQISPTSLPPTTLNYGQSEPS